MEMRPKSSRLGREHGLPKIHKDYTNIPSFSPIVDRTGTAHYGVGKYLSNLLNLLTLNEYSLKDSFELTQRIHSIPTDLFTQGYRYVSFDVVSLFTNLLLKKTMGSSLGPVLANIIMTQMESEIVKSLETKGVIKHYMGYVDDTLLLITPENIETGLRKFNSFRNNLHFTLDTFDGGNIHFLDLKIEGIETDVYNKPTHTGQYFDFTSQTP